MDNTKEKVMLLGKWGCTSGQYIEYRAACGCMSPQCDIHISLELEDDILSLTFYKKIYYANYFSYRNSFIEKLKVLYTRIRDSFKLLFTGELVYESDFIFTGSRHIQSFIDALEEGKKYVSQGRSICK